MGIFCLTYLKSLLVLWASGLVSSWLHDTSVWLPCSCLRGSSLFPGCLPVSYNQGGNSYGSHISKYIIRRKGSSSSLNNSAQLCSSFPVWGFAHIWMLHWGQWNNLLDSLRYGIPTIPIPNFVSMRWSSHSMQNPWLPKNGLEKE